MVKFNLSHCLSFESNYHLCYKSKSYSLGNDCLLTTYIRCYSPAQVIFKKGETDMGDKGKKDKGKREQQKKAQLNPKDKRKLKKEKKNK